ncbi:glycosyltransferase family 2 protein [Paludisphaera rhizosphaerae]|uniref:glycosyltransferase family 2 protein n=1 Tax=Paludisphaera rhizosphaerae TaxID=2711216 RepID=UPI0013ED86E9|nr:glycosyltransferase family 2 protein [Paludisphaera rhizosphaerae]
MTGRTDSTPRTNPPTLSAVAPLFDEQESVAELHRRLTDALASTGLSYEIIFVDDGARDRTPEQIDELAARDSHVIAVHLSRNFGHQPAVSAGLDRARGDAVIVLDGDLQDPPELIPDLVVKWREGFDVVYAVRRRRDEPWHRRLGYFAFYRLMAALSDLEIPLDSGDFCLMDRRVVDVLTHLPERMRFIRGLRSFVGFRQTGLEYDRPSRVAGSSKYSFRRLVALAVDGLVSFSGRPLRLATYLGLSAVAVALGLLAWILYDAFIHLGSPERSAPKGWASTAVIVLFMGSAQLLCLGIIGEYIRLIFLETKGRPTYIVREDDRKTPPQSDADSRVD